MPTFNLTVPTGESYQVEAPDAAAAAGAIQQMHGGAVPAAPPAPPASIDPYAQPPQGEPSDVATANYGQRAGDLGRAALQGASLGFYPASPESLARSGPAGTVAQFAGGMLPFVATEGGLGLAGMGAGLGRMAATGAITGAGQTAGTEFGTGQPLSAPGIAMGAWVGGAAGALAHGLAAGLGRLGATMPNSGVTPATIKPMVESAYKEVKNLGASYDPDAFSGLVDRIKQAAENADINPLIHPKTTAFIGKMEGLANRGATPSVPSTRTPVLGPEGQTIRYDFQPGSEASPPNTPITLTELDQLRQAAGRDLGSSPDAGERFFGQKIKSGIDTFINSNPAMAAGSSPEAAATIATARDLAQRNFKYQDLADALRKAQDRAGANTTGNIETSMRQKMIPFQEGQNNLSPDEAALTQQAIHGTPVQNVLRHIGKLAPTSFFPAAGEIAGLAGGFPGVASLLAGAGMAAKLGSTAMGNTTARKLEQTILEGGRMPARITPDMDALAQALALAQLQAAQRARAN